MCLLSFGKNESTTASHSTPEVGEMFNFAPMAWSADLAKPKGNDPIHKKIVV